MYSEYNGRETYKTLVGITPQWNCSFVSHPYYGSLSDLEIVGRNGLLNPNMFDDGDEIMADKGFNIKDLTDKLTCQFFLDPGVSLKIMKIEKTTEYTWDVL